MRPLLPPTSFVIPCLNEAGTLARVIAAIDHVRFQFTACEILIVDNGSHDDSAAIAKACGARVVHCAQRGYGAALKAGIAHAINDFVVCADADGTYDLTESVKLVDRLHAGCFDIVVGNRLKGRIEAGAMPFLNRTLGTPVLSLLITALFGWRSGVRVGDCNGGMRAIRRTALEGWDLRCGGMEFASEMIVAALRQGDRYTECAVSYRRALPNRASNLRRWRDGLAHLRQILFMSIESSRKEPEVLPLPIREHHVARIRETRHYFDHL